MFASHLIYFQELQSKDFPLLTRWLNQPYVHEWYDKDEINTLEEVTKRYDFKAINEPTDGYIVYYEGSAVGYIQKYYPKDWKEFHEATGYGEGVTGIDLFIGDPAFMGRGFGSFMIHEFLKQIVFAEDGITKCIIDPEPDNKRAIKAYEKVGFRYIRTVKIPEEKELAYLMEIKKDDLN